MFPKGNLGKRATFQAGLLYDYLANLLVSISSQDQERKLFATQAECIGLENQLQKVRDREREPIRR